VGPYPVLHKVVSWSFQTELIIQYMLAFAIGWWFPIQNSPPLSSCTGSKISATAGSATGTDFGINCGKVNMVSLSGMARKIPIW